MDHIHTTPWMDCSQKPLELDLSEPDKTSEMMHKIIYYLSYMALLAIGKSRKSGYNSWQIFTNGPDETPNRGQNIF